MCHINPKALECLLQTELQNCSLIISVNKNAFNAIVLERLITITEDFISAQRNFILTATAVKEFCNHKIERSRGRIARGVNNYSSTERHFDDEDVTDSPRVLFDIFFNILHVFQAGP